MAIPGIVQTAGLPGSKVIPAINHFLSFLALKLIGTERYAHIGDHAFDPGWALSVAHCFVDDRTDQVDNDFVVVLGTMSLRNPAPGYERIPVAAVYVHPYYDRFTTDNVAYWGRAGDPGGLEYWLGEVNRGATDVPGVAENFALSAEAKAMYPYFNSPETATDEERTAFVQAVYQNLLNRDVPADDEGVVYWVGELREGRTTPGAVIGNIIHAAIQAESTDWLTIWHKVQVAEYFTQRFEAQNRVWQEGGFDLARQALVGVTDDPATVDAGKARVEQLLP